MLIAVISDIHDNLANLSKCLEWCKKNKVEQIICCGDIANGGTLKFLANNFSKPIHLIRGNMEIYGEDEVKQFNNIKYYGRSGKAEVEGKKIGICHEPFFIDKILEQEKCDIIFYGHTHKPWIKAKNRVQLINPGTLGGVFQKATFATWNTRKGNMELKILEKM